MKFKLTFKTPDVLDQVDDEAAKDFARKFIHFGEYIDVEFDTETQTATVRKIK